jgi:hypothetical protein
MKHSIRRFTGFVVVLAMLVTCGGCALSAHSKDSKSPSDVRRSDHSEEQDTDPVEAPEPISY